MGINSKLVKQTIGNKDIIGTFEELLGTKEDSINLPITHPKYVKIESNAMRFLKLLNLLSKSKFMNNFESINNDLLEYIKLLEKNHTEVFTAPDLENYIIKDEKTLEPPSYKSVPDNVKKEFGIVYNKSKKSNIVNIVIVICKNLIVYKKYIENKDELSDLFITKSAGNKITPFPELDSLNIKRIYNDDSLNSNDRKFILVSLSKLYEISYEMYTILSNPDVDVDQFITIIISSIDIVKKQIPRCNEAFDKIVKSVGILKSNFNGYYKDFMSCNNPSIIMENFILDVSKDTTANKKITSQFRRIISHYRNLAGKRPMDDRVNTLFKHVDKHFDVLDKLTDNDEVSAEAEAEAEAEVEAETEARINAGVNDDEIEVDDGVDYGGDDEIEVDDGVDYGGDDGDAIGDEVDGGEDVDKVE